MAFKFRGRSVVLDQQEFYLYFDQVVHEHVRATKIILGITVNYGINVLGFFSR